jgi:DNA repair photolyase
MPLVQAVGNMYPPSFTQWCWSPLVNGCWHQCTYCYAKKRGEISGTKWGNKPRWSKDTRFAEDGSIESPSLPAEKIFVCHTTDLFSENIDDLVVEKVISHCYTEWLSNDSMNMKLIFQTKNPERMSMFAHLFRMFNKQALMFGTTIETNRLYQGISNAPPVQERSLALSSFVKSNGYESFVTVEPIMDFDTQDMVSLVSAPSPSKVWIGADSKDSRLIEPGAIKVNNLAITLIRRGIRVGFKSNITRIVPRLSWPKGLENN